MPGASPDTRRVKNLNANWSPDAAPPDGAFELQVITDDGEQHTLRASPTSMVALVALTQADAVLAWDPTNRALIAANLVGTMPWTESSDGH